MTTNTRPAAEFTTWQRVRIMRRATAWNPAHQAQTLNVGDIASIDMAQWQYGDGWRYRVEFGGYLAWVFEDDIAPCRGGSQV